MRVRSSRIVTPAIKSPERDRTDNRSAAVVADDDNGLPRRFAARRTTAMPGGILVDAVSPPIPCVIRNTSSTGALIELKTSLGTWSHSATDLPDDFVLIMNADNLAFDCEVARRSGNQVGVRFTGPARPLTRSHAKPMARGPARPVAQAAKVVKGASMKSGLGVFGRRG